MLFRPIHKTSGYTRILAACLALLVSAPSYAHEFWIEPRQSDSSNAGTLTATLHVGQDLKGNSYSYIPRRFARFDHTINGQTSPHQARLGDNPAVQIKDPAAGLHIFSYQSTPESLIYPNAQKFADFVAYDGLDGVLEAHAARGLPEKGFKEAYTRFAKALVQIGASDTSTPQQDQSLGLKLELVAQTNPFTAYTNGQARFSVQLLKEGIPLANIQIATFQRGEDDRVERRLTRSDNQGMAEIDITSGGFFLLSAVHMVEPPEDAFPDNASLQQAVWHSLWASLTFRLPY